MKLPGGGRDGTGRRRHGQGRVLLVAVPVVRAGAVPAAGGPTGQRQGHHRRALGTGAPAGPLVGVEEDADVGVAGLEGDLEGRAAVDVEDRGVALGVGQEEPHDVEVAVLGGAHQGRAAVLVLEVDRGAGVQEEPRHVLAAVRDGQHEGRLAVLEVEKVRR